MIPGGRMNPRMLQQMMRQLGITVEDVGGVERVVIETATKDLVFTRPAVSAMKAQGQVTYQVQGQPEVVPKGQAAAGKEAMVPRPPSASGPGAAPGPEPEAPRPLFTDEDVRLVVEATGASRDKARQALEECEGEVATAIVKLTGG